MTASTKDREARMSPGDVVAYQGASGYTLYAGCGVMLHNNLVRPIAQGSGISTATATYLGIARNGAIGNTGVNGASVVPLEVFKTGVFSLVANGTGASADIGKDAYWIDDQTVGTSCAKPYFVAGKVVGLDSTSSYRVRITLSVDGSIANS
jgi:hypothetical protein